MATFYYNRSSGESATSQWTRYLQTQSYISDIGEIVSQNRKHLESTLSAASVEHRRAIQQVCGTLDDGFREVSQHLEKINFNISGLRSEICAMAAMLDWKLSLIIEEQRLTNELLGQVVRLLRIPDSQKQRAYHIEQGLKYWKNAIREGIGSTFYADAFEGFKEAERIERKDYITLNRIGQIHLYSQQHMDIPLAEEYFLKSAREALAEDNAGGTPTATHFVPKGVQPLIDSASPFKAATAEAYLYAARACYLQGKLQQAAAHAGNALRVVPEFVQAGFEQAKYLAAHNEGTEAAKILRGVIRTDRYFAIKTLSDADLCSQEPVLGLLEHLQREAVSRGREEVRRCREIARPGSRALEALGDADRLLSSAGFLSAMSVLDELTEARQRPLREYADDAFGYKTLAIYYREIAPPLSFGDFIIAQNAAERHLDELTEEVKRGMSRERIWKIQGYSLVGAAIGLVGGFFAACSPSQLSLDGGQWFITGIVFAGGGALVGWLAGSDTEPPVEPYRGARPWRDRTWLN